MKKRVVITGGSGLLALNWACAMRSEWDIVLGVHLHSVTLAEAMSYRLNMDDPIQLERQLEQLSPDLIVHAAGLTNVDSCEDQPTLARQANAQIARNVALASANKNIKLIHISTDHLFSGDNSFYSEEMQPNPINEYARSKLLAEEWVQEICPNSLIVRTNFFGWGNFQRQSFSDWIIYNLRAGKALALFDDVFFTPILADTLATTAHDLAERGASGIFNLVGDERVSKYEFAGNLAYHFNLPRELIARSQMSLATLRAPRPHDMSLSNAKAKNILGKGLGCIDQYMAELFSQEIEGRRMELFHAVS